MTRLPCTNVPMTVELDVAATRTAWQAERRVGCFLGRAVDGCMDAEIWVLPHQKDGFLIFPFKLNTQIWLIWLRIHANFFARQKITQVPSAYFVFGRIGTWKLIQKILNVKEH